MYELHLLNTTFEVAGFSFGVVVGGVSVCCELVHSIPSLCQLPIPIAFNVRKWGCWFLLLFFCCFVVFCCFVLSLDITQCPQEGKSPSSSLKSIALYEHLRQSKLGEMLLISELSFWLVVVLKILPAIKSSFPSFLSKGELEQWSQFSQLGIHIRSNEYKYHENRGGEVNMFTLLLVYTKLLISGFVRNRHQEYEVQTIHK